MAPVIQMLPAGTWIDITSDVKAESGIKTSRGRQRLTDSTSSALSLVLKNPAGKYSSDRPGTPYYRQLGRGTQIRVLEPLVRDTFARTVSNGWGSTETDLEEPLPLTPVAWQNGAGSSSDYSVTAGVGRHTLSTVSTSRQSRLNLVLRPSVVTASVTIGATTTGASAYASIVARKTSTGVGGIGFRHYRAELEFGTGGTVTASIIRLSGPGGDVSIATPVVVGSYSGGSKWWIQFTCVGPQLYLKAWPDGQPEPTAFTVAAEDAHLRKGQIALQSARNASNTNSNLTFDFDNVTVMHPDFWGEIWSLRPMNAQGGADLTMTVQAGGILQRLSNTDKPIRSALYRGITLGVLEGDEPPVAYWPLEDGKLATQLEAYGTGVQPGQFSGAVTMASDSALTGSAPLPSVGGGGSLTGKVPLFTGFDAATDTWTVNFLAKIDEAPDAETVIAQFGTNTEAACYEIAMDSGGNVIFRTPKLFRLTADPYVFTTTRSYNSTFNLTSPSLFGRWVNFTLVNVPGGGSSYTVVLQWRDAVLASANTLTLSPPDGSTIWREPNRSWQLFGPTSGSTSFGHLVVHAQFFTFSGPESSGYVAERARTRLSRLADEEGVTVQTVGTGSETMGPQLLAPLLKNLEDCTAADLGLMSESRHILGLEYRAHQYLYNQYPAAVIDVSNGELNDGLSPIRDDQRGLANEVTATRDGGTAQTFTIPDGDVHHLTTEDPPTGIGLVRGSMSPNVETDRQTHQHAAWRTHHGASRAARYEKLTVKLHALPYSSDPQLTANMRALGEGDVIRLDAAPALIEATLPPGPRELMVQGIDQYRDGEVDQITFNCTPADDWRVWCMDTGGSQIDVAVDSDETSLKVSTSLGPAWKTSPDPGWSIQGMTGGEAMFVTGCTTDTPAFIAAGTVATGNNASVVPGLPAGMTADTGQLMVMFAAIRNSGTGTVNTPAGWTVLAQVSPQRNVTVFRRFFVTGDTAPTVSFTSGVAGADTMARIFAFSGLSHQYGGSPSSLKSAKRTPLPVLQLNGSAQDIAYPAYYVHRNNSVVLVFGWKQDDWTGVAPPAGFTEMGDNATTTGDDSGIAAYYQIQTTATNIAAGSLVVTGGASAISRSVVVALRPLQTLTVERAVNGVAGSLVEGEALHVWNHGAVPL